MQKAFQSADYPQVEPVLDLLCAGLKPILAEQLVGIYLYGSLITGDFDPAISDIDLVVVLTRELDDREFAALHQLHQDVVEAFPAWDDRLELAYISRAALRNFRTQSSCIGIISPGEPFHRVQAGRDWLISWYALREQGLALHGPPIETLLEPIAPEEYIQAVAEHINTYRQIVKTAESKAYLSYIVITMVRGMYTVRQGQPTSKLKAADWGKAAYPQWAALINHALLWRANPGTDGLTIAEIRPQVQALVDDLLAQLPS